jgi:hypothetical protein
MNQYAGGTRTIKTPYNAETFEAEDYGWVITHKDSGLRTDSFRTKSQAEKYRDELKQNKTLRTGMKIVKANSNDEPMTLDILNYLDRKDAEGELKTIYGAESPARMSQEELLDFFNSLKPKEEILIWYNSGIRKADDWTPMTVGRRSESKKYNLKKISLTGKRGGKFTLYNRQGKISLAMGDMATVLISAKKNDRSYEAETFNAQYDFDKSFDPKGDEHKCWYDDHEWICYDINARNDSSTFDITLMCEECGMKVDVGGAIGILTEKGKGAESFEAKGIDTLAKPFEEIGIPKTYARLGVITAGITALAFGVMKLKDR